MFGLKRMSYVLLPILLVAGVAALLIYWKPGETAGTQAASGEWTCSMHPQIRQNKPGQCPICGMNLIPVSQLKDLAETEKRAGIETEPITYRELVKEIRTVGKLDYNESRVAYITARIAGRVDRVFADFTGIQVKKDDHLVDIYSPDLFVAQGELFRALETLDKATGDKSFAENSLEAARTKLRLLGILPEQLAQLEQSRKVNTHLTIYSPIGGTVIDKSVRAGQYVKEGDMLYRIADLDPIWLYLDIFEYDLGWIGYGQPVEVTLEAYPSETFRGVVVFIDPFLDDKTRTVKVRVNLKNADRRLKPAMYASALIRVRLLSNGLPEPTGMEGKFICPMHPEVVQDKPGACPICQMPLEPVPKSRSSEVHQVHVHKDQAEMEKGKTTAGVLAIRATAVLDTGRRKITYRQTKDGSFELVELQLGPKAEAKVESGEMVSYFPVLKGLKVGDRVVIRGGFLLDSQQQISGMPSLLYEKGQTAAGLHAGHGGSGQSAPKPKEDSHKH